MSKTPKFDAKVKAILDATKPGERTCALTGEKWNMTDEEIGWYKKFNVPPSKFHPEMRRRLLFGFPSGVAIWRKPHMTTKEPILSFVHPDSPYQVVTDKEWAVGEYLREGPELDASRPFFDQFESLAHAVPVSALRADPADVNTIGVDTLKIEDSQMVFGCAENKRCFYLYTSYQCEDCVDIANTRLTQDCYAINRSKQLHQCQFVFESAQCQQSAFLFDCKNLDYCFGATNKVNKKYLWFNEQLTKEEWEKRRATVDLSSRAVLEEYYKRFYDLIAKAAWPPSYIIGSEDCTGEYLQESVRCHDSYWVNLGVDLYSCFMAVEFQQSAFSIWIGWGSDVYYTCDHVGGPVKFCFRTWDCTDMEYSMDCRNCEHCFGCAGLKRKKYCIFNVQYTPEAYWKKLDEIKCAMLDRGEYGEFFPAKFSQSGFQFSMGDLFAEYTPEEYRLFAAPKFDPNRAAVHASMQDGEAALTTDTLPDRLADASESLVGKPIFDKKLGRNYSIAPLEWAFYQRHKLAIPSEHFLSRLRNIVRTSNSPVKMAASCSSCGTEITTYKNATFPKRNLMCRPCYLKYLEKNN